jgi:hypothetical protein
MTGLFNKMKGRSSNAPVVRTGNVALMPDPGETLSCMKGFRDAEAYLVEARSIGGLSGSPAFVRETLYYESEFGPRGAPPETLRAARLAGCGSFYLLGLVHGHWEIDPEERNEPDPMAVAREEPNAVNMGIAVVVPAKKIREVLYHPDLVEARRTQDEEAVRSEGTTTPD